jgi:hypothetical protein
MRTFFVAVLAAVMTLAASWIASADERWTFRATARSLPISDCLPRVRPMYHNLAAKCRAASLSALTERSTSWTSMLTAVACCSPSIRRPACAGS